VSDEPWNAGAENDRAFEDRTRGMLLIVGTIALVACVVLAVFVIYGAV
jgi:hypothetical protein